MRAIDADALLKAIIHMSLDGNVFDQIRNAPTIEPHKKGEWIKHVDDLFPAESTLECSVCHHQQPLTIDDNYCPNCGVEMGGQDA